MEFGAAMTANVLNMFSKRRITAAWLLGRQVGESNWAAKAHLFFVGMTRE